MSAHDHHDTENSCIVNPASPGDPPRSRRDMLKAAGAVASLPVLSALMPLHRTALAMPATPLEPSSANMPLEPITQAFINGLDGATPLYKLSAQAAHQVLTDIQSAPIAVRCSTRSPARRRRAAQSSWQSRS